jgi:hypothetical protein
MSTVEDPFEVVAAEEADKFAELSPRGGTLAESPPPALPGVATARFHGFDMDERPLIAGAFGLAGELVPARTTVRLLREQIGSTVVVLFEQNDARLPIIVGVLQDRRSFDSVARSPEAPLVSVQVDDDRMVLRAEREIVLRCGDASITLRRAGKVLIKGAYILSRSTGYNKIKGAAVDIN